MHKYLNNNLDVTTISTKILDEISYTNLKGFLVIIPNELSLDDSISYTKSCKLAGLGLPYRLSLFNHDVRKLIQVIQPHTIIFDKFTERQVKLITENLIKKNPCFDNIEIMFFINKTTPYLRDAKLLSELVEEDCFKEQPNHYHGSKMEPFEILEQEPEKFENFCYGNVIKYMQRYDTKGTPIEDLEKAITYIEKIIEIRGNNNDKIN